MLFLTCTMLSSVDHAHNGVSRAKDWVSVNCGTMQYFYSSLLLFFILLVFYLLILRLTITMTMPAGRVIFG